MLGIKGDLHGRDDRTLAVGGVLEGRYDRALDVMSEIIEGRGVAPWQAVDLRVRARRANQAVREREAAAVPTVTVASVYNAQRPEPLIDGIVEYRKVPCEPLQALVYRHGLGVSWRAAMF